MSASMPDPAASSLSDEVCLCMPATAENVSLARSLAAAVAVRADLPVADLEDLRLAVSEAVTGAVTDAQPGSQVRCSFVEQAACVIVRVSYRPRLGHGPDTDGFGWAIMRALATELTAETDQDQVILTLRIERSVPVQA
ncbi:MAG: ATP-binding protein [Actinomycetales bacterium]